MCWCWFAYITFSREPQSALIQGVFNLPAWSEPCSSDCSRGIHSEGVFTSFLLLYTSQNSVWEPNKGRPAWLLPTTKPVQRERLNLPLPHPCTSPRTSLMSSKTMFIFPLCATALFMSYPYMLHWGCVCVWATGKGGGGSRQTITSRLYIVFYILHDDMFGELRLSPFENVPTVKKCLSSY